MRVDSRKSALVIFSSQGLIQGKFTQTVDEMTGHEMLAKS